MPENLESFVKKLQSEGVEAGREAADKLKKEAEQQAEEILAHAREEAEGIVREAEDEAERRRNHTQAELEMAARDVVLRLRDSLSRALSALITERVSEGLKDPDYLKGIIKELVVAYARGDATREKQMDVHVSRDLPDDWIRHLLTDLSQTLQKPEKMPRIQADLTRAGFDYRVEDAAIEVSPDSVTEVLLEMVNPELQAIVQRAVTGGAT